MLSSGTETVRTHGHHPAPNSGHGSITGRRHGRTGPAAEGLPSCCQDTPPPSALAPATESPGIQG